MQQFLPTCFMHFLWLLIVYVCMYVSPLKTTKAIIAVYVINIFSFFSNELLIEKSQPKTKSQPSI